MLPYSPLHHLLLADVGRAARDDQRQRLRRADRLSRTRTRCERLGGDRRPVPAPRPPDPDAHRRLGRARRGAGGGAAAVCGARAATCPPASPLPRRRARRCWPCGAELKNTFCVARASAPGSATTSATSRTTRRCAPSPRGSSTSSACSPSSPRSWRTTCTPSTSRRKYALERDGVELDRRPAPPRAPGRVPGRARRDRPGGRRDLRRHRLRHATARLGRRAAARRPRRLRARGPPAARCGMPGGEAAIREPWRMACAWLAAAVRRAAGRRRALAGTVDRRRWRQVAALAQSGLASPLTTSVGRLFDAVAALCGVRARGQLRGPGGDRARGRVRSGRAAPPTRCR